jgi:hypothetical protein
MAGTPRKNPVLTNPFFVALLVVSTLFVVTALAYLVSAYELDSERMAARPPSAGPAAWLDRHGPLVLGIEFVVMLVMGVIAMLTEDWFMGRPKRGDTKT